MIWPEPWCPQNFLEEESGEAKFSVGQQFGQISGEIGAGDPSRGVKSPKSLADAISMLCGAAIVQFKWLVETE